MRYAIAYEYQDDTGRKLEGESVIDAANPVAALNRFHDYMQFGAGFRPDEYRLTVLAERYPRVVDGTTLTSHPLDIPNTPNPDLMAVRNAYATPEPDNQTGFGFAGEGVA